MGSLDIIKGPVFLPVPFSADMVELADTPDLGSGAVRRTGSSPAIRTSQKSQRASRVRGFFLFGICIKNPEAGMIAGLSGFCHAINIWDFPQ